MCSQKFSKSNLIISTVWFQTNICSQKPYYNIANSQLCTTTTEAFLKGKFPYYIFDFGILFSGRNICTFMCIFEPAVSFYLLSCPGSSGIFPNVLQGIFLSHLQIIITHYWFPSCKWFLSSKSHFNQIQWTIPLLLLHLDLILFRLASDTVTETTFLHVNNDNHKIRFKGFYSHVVFCQAHLSNKWSLILTPQKLFLLIPYQWS